MENNEEVVIGLWLGVVGIVLLFWVILIWASKLTMTKAIKPRTCRICGSPNVSRFKDVWGTWWDCDRCGEVVTG